MSDGLQKLRNIGVDKIYAETHIARKHIETLLDGNFDNINKIHLLGFISILEREYKVDLSDLKLNAEEFYGNTIKADREEAGILLSTNKKKNNRVVYISIIAILFIITMFFSIDSPTTTPTKIKANHIDNSRINVAKAKIIENNITKDINISSQKSVAKDENATLKNGESIETVKSFKIIPSSRVWLGYIDRSNYRKYQKTATKELVLDPTKEWLFIFGHSNVRVEIDGEIVKFKGKQNVRLYYKDSKLTKLTIAEFKKLNRGKKW